MLNTLYTWFERIVPICVYNVCEKCINICECAMIFHDFEMDDTTKVMCRRYWEYGMKTP